MRILHLISDLSGGGAERQLCYLATELAQMGHEVHVAYCNEGPSRTELPGVVLHRLKIRSNHDPSLFWQVFWLVMRVKPQIMQTWLLQMDVIGGIVSHLYRIPCVFREPSSSLAYTMNLKTRLRIWAASRAGAIICNSRGGASYWEELLPGRRPQIVINGLPVEAIAGAQAPLPMGLDAVKIPIVLYVGRINPGKNIMALVEVFSRVTKKQPALLVICGEGPQQHELQSLVREKDLERRVVFTGFLPTASVWSLMKKAEIFVSLSHYEGCPNTVMEAMASGCPVVLSDIPAHREIADESCAVFVEPNKLDQTADSFSKVMNDREGLMARASAAKQRTEEWSIKNMVYNYERIYKEIICQ